MYLKSEKEDVILSTDVSLFALRSYIYIYITLIYNVSVLPVVNKILLRK